MTFACQRFLVRFPFPSCFSAQSVRMLETHDIPALDRFSVSLNNQRWVEQEMLLYIKDMILMDLSAKNNNLSGQKIDSLIDIFAACLGGPVSGRIIELKLNSLPVTEQYPETWSQSWWKANRKSPLPIIAVKCFPFRQLPKPYPSPASTQTHDVDGNQVQRLVFNHTQIWC